MDFDQIIAPLPRAAFLSEYWNKSFLRLPGKAGRFTDLLPWDELNRILEQHRLAPPRFKLFQDGRHVDPGLYLAGAMDGVARVHLGKLVALLAQGASMIIDQVDELAPRVNSLTHSFRDVLHTGNYVNLYAGWHSQKGFDLHWDSQDTFMLQLSGRKHWKIYQPTRPYPLQDDLEVPPQPSGKPFWEGVLEDGDALYIPRGWWHIAYPLNVPSLHLTVATVPPRGVDMLHWLVGKLRRHLDVRRDLPLPEDAAAQQPLLDHLRKLVSEALTGTAMADFQREWESQLYPQPLIRLPLAPYAQNAAVTPQTRIRLASQNRLACERPYGQTAYFLANNLRWACPAALVPALESLTDTADQPVAKLCESLPDAGAAGDLKMSLAALAKAGVVLLDSA